MSTYITVSPAYGRDYKSAKDAQEAWASGLDFILHDLTSSWDGKPCSVRDFPPDTHVNIRYHNLTQITPAKTAT